MRDFWFRSSLWRLCLVGSTVFAAGANGDERMNVVLIVADDLGWADLGCYGSKFHRTPNLDRMAAEGVRFTDAYAACPVCSPTRAAIMTGKWPARLHLTDWLPGRGDRSDQRLLRPTIRQELPLEETTLAELLRGAGYSTGHLGKWHLGGVGFEPETQGFDINIAGNHTGTPFSYFAPFKGRDRDGRDRFMPGLETAPDGEYLTDRLAAEAEKFLDQHRDRPFFLYLPHHAVHTPMKAPAELVAHYSDKEVPGQQSNATYAAMLESLDTAVGRVLRKIEDLKLTDRTLICFTSDNGGLATTEGPKTPATNNAPLREGKGYLYEGGIRVPLLVKGPKVAKSGRTVATPVISHDFVPTILELVGIPTTVRFDGISFAPLLFGEERLARETLYWHYPHYSNQGGRPSGAIRDGNLKLIEFYETERRELFDLASDQRENRNLVRERPADVERLAQKLAAWKRDVGAQEMARNPSFAPNPQAADGTITLPARTADVHGVQLRYEPLPHKNTLGFWTNADDWASIEFTVLRPGRFDVEVHQGCGTGQGGSEVEFSVAGQTLPMTVVDTGHFQNFQPRTIGTVDLVQPGRLELTIHVKSKAKAAVMDVRQIVLRPAKS